MASNPPKTDVFAKTVQVAKKNIHEQKKWLLAIGKK